MNKILFFFLFFIISIINTIHPMENEEIARLTIEKNKKNQDFYFFLHIKTEIERLAESGQLWQNLERTRIRFEFFNELIKRFNRCMEREIFPPKLDLSILLMIISPIHELLPKAMEILQNPSTQQNPPPPSIKHRKQKPKKHQPNRYSKQHYNPIQEDEDNYSNIDECEYGEDEAEYYQSDSYLKTLYDEFRPKTPY